MLDVYIPTGGDFFISNPYRCLGTWCTKTGKIIEDFDALNNSPINIRGKDLVETLRRGIFSLRYLKWYIIDEYDYPLSTNDDGKYIEVRYNSIHAYDLVE